MDELYSYAPTVMALNQIIFSNKLLERRTMHLLTAYDIMTKEYEQYRRRVLPNNYLKMHGIPMRRGRKRWSLT